jgi:hypothetical protein
MDSSLDYDRDISIIKAIAFTTSSITINLGGTL